MLDQIFDLVKSLAGKDVINNPDVPNEHNDAVVAEATHSVTGELQNMLSGGGLQNIMSLFGGGTDKTSLLQNPAVDSMIGHFAGNLMNKFGLENSKAAGIASSLIPTVLSGLIHKTQDPNNSTFTLDNILHSLTGGQSQQVAANQGSGFSFQNLLNQFTGGGQPSGGSGGGGLMNLITQIAGGAQTAQHSQGTGGLLDIIKGFIK